MAASKYVSLYSDFSQMFFFFFFLFYLFYFILFWDLIFFFFSFSPVDIAALGSKERGACKNETRNHGGILREGKVSRGGTAWYICYSKE